ncbi:MAG: hypothetical protein E7624_06885 [Ruminococcaceae bacterium]|nr:hypothetical protein [Oscillospiraceae bacterium]
MLYGDGKHDDTRALQEMLDACGIVTIEKPGTYLVCRTLLIHSHTRLVLAPGVTLLAAPRSCCALIQNEHFEDPGKKDVQIEIVGGIFDGNCDEMGLDPMALALTREDAPYSPARFSGKLLRFAHVQNILLEKLTVRDPVGYGIQIADAEGFITRDIYFDYNSHFGCTDGVHVNGPARNGVIENVYGVTNDDVVSLTTVDEMHAEVTKGEIEDVEIRNVSSTNGYSAVRLLSSGGFAMRHIRICGIYGTYRHYGILISHHDIRPGTANFFDGITVEHVHASKADRPLPPECFCYWEGDGIEKRAIIRLRAGKEALHVGRLVLRDVVRHQKTPTSAPLVQLDSGVSIDRLVLDNLHQTAAPGITLPLVINDAEIGELIARDVQG